MYMEIQVRLQLMDSEASYGVRLWAIALDGSNRSWFKWYENQGTAMIDAEHMRLAETVSTPSEQRHSVFVYRRLLPETEIEEDVLNTHWHKQ